MAIDRDPKSAIPNFNIGTKKPPVSTDNALWLMQNLLQPQSLGYDQINLDLSFTNLQHFDVERIMNLSFIINFSRMFKLPKSRFLSNGDYATLLNAKRSVGGWSGSLLTTTVTKASSEYKDASNERARWKLFSFRKKEDK